MLNINNRNGNVNNDDNNDNVNNDDNVDDSVNDNNNGLRLMKRNRNYWSSK